MTRLRVIFLVEQNDASNDQIAACVGFAHSMGLNMTIVPEEGPKRDRLKWNHGSSKNVDTVTRVAIEEALKKSGSGGVAQRKAFVDALSSRLKKKPRETGKLVAKWVREGILEEVE